MIVNTDTIKSTDTFRKIQTSNKTYKFFGKYFLCLFFQEKINSTQASNQIFLYIGIKASRKFGNAVTRNKFKRRIRCLFYANKDLYNHYTSQLFYFVFIPTKVASSCSFSDMKQEYDKMSLLISNKLNTKS